MRDFKNMLNTSYYNLKKKIPQFQSVTIAQKSKEILKSKETFR